MRKLLLSIKPKYVKQILSGTKLVEYRKQKPKDTGVDRVLIYQSNDLQKVVGEFKISGIIEGTPLEVWNTTSDVGGICREDYFSYFKNSARAYAFQISELKVYDTPIQLEELGVSRAPMSYKYVNLIENAQS